MYQIEYELRGTPSYVQQHPHNNIGVSHTITHDLREHGF